MAMVADARALIDLIGKGAAFARQTGLGWYKASRAMRSFRLKLAILQQKSNSWTSLLNRHGLTGDTVLTLVLAEAIKLVEEEQLKLAHLEQSCFSRMGRKLLFPESVTEALDDVIKAFQNIDEMIRDQEDSRQTFEKLSLSQVARLPFRPDSKYVPLKKSILKVQVALESKTSGSIVVLCGGSGQGKSSMARYLACLYQDGIDPICATESRQEQNLGSQICPPKLFGDGVFFLHCGNEANSKCLLSQLWQDLGYQSLPTPNDQGLGTPTDEVSISVDSEGVLRKQLFARLANQELLIIVDDVWDATIVDKIFLQQPGVKYLITTQKERLWIDANCAEIQISHPTRQEAEQILTNHVKGFPKEVSSDIQDQIDIIIGKCDDNPLVLANIAATIRHGAALEEWKHACEYFSDLRAGDDKRPVSLYGRTYSKITMGASIAMALSFLPPEVQKLLFIASVCEVQPIPEVVFKILFKHVHSSLAQFLKCSQELETSNFIRIVQEPTLGSSISKKSWIMHSMHHDFISLLKHEEIDLMFTRLLGEIDHHDQIDCILLVLYGQGKWCEQAKQKLGIPLNGNCSKWHSSRWTPIKPIVWLLNENCEKERDRYQDCEEEHEKSHHLAKKIIHEYLVSNQLHDDYMSKLLALPSAMPFGCEVFLKNAFKIEVYPCTLHQLIALLQDGVLPNVQQNAAWVLAELSSQVAENAINIGAYPNALERFIALLRNGVPSNVQENAAWALGELSSQVVENAIKIGAYPHALERLIALLGDRVPSNVQENAAWALGQLSRQVVENAIKIGAYQDALERIIALLEDGVAPNVQQHATWALGQLSWQVVENAIKIGAYPHALERLIALLGDGVPPNVQENAAWALAQLSRQVVENAIKIGAYPYALERLIALLGGGVPLNVQQDATWALGELSSQVVENAVKIGVYPNALERLIAMLGNGVPPNLQQRAAHALGQLSSQVVENAIKIVVYPNALGKLIALLGDGVPPNVQQHAACALGNLSIQVVENAIKIGAYPAALQRLIALLGDGVPSNVQEYAAWALGQLSEQVVENAIKIGAHPHALERLITLLGDEVPSKVQQNAAWVLGQLSSQVVKNANQIGVYPHALEKLIALLGDGVHPNVQENATWALGQLSSQVVENAIKIGAYPHALERLIALLGDGVPPNVQENAAWALGQLSRQVVENAIKIGAYPHALERLIVLLGDGVLPNVQQDAAWALGELSGQVVENAIKIGAYPDALKRLIALLGDGVPPSLQQRAAGALGQLSSQVVENAIKIGVYPNALGRLIALLEDGVPPNVQENAAWVLGQLSCQVVENAIKIGVYPDALEKLIVLLGDGVHPNVQQEAAWALGQLSSQVVENAIKIGAYPHALERLIVVLEDGVPPNWAPHVQEHAT